MDDIKRLLLGSACDNKKNEFSFILRYFDFKICFTGANPTKLFFFINEEFFRFLLLSLAVVQYTHFFHMLQTFKLNSENQKTEKMKVW